jgi:hypothetical protein
VYVALCFGLRSYIPIRLYCCAERLFYSSVFALAAVYCILVGAAGSPIRMKRDEHPVSFWTIVGCAFALSVVLALAGVGVVHTPSCLK